MYIKNSKKLIQLIFCSFKIEKIKLNTKSYVYTTLALNLKLCRLYITYIKFLSSTKLMEKAISINVKQCHVMINKLCVKYVHNVQA